MMTMTGEFREESYVILGIKKLGLGVLCAKTVGEHSSVSPNVMFIVKHLKWVVGTYHTHPGAAYASPTDEAAWEEETKMYSPPIYFMIEGEHRHLCLKWTGERDLRMLRKARMVKLWKIVWFY